MKKLKYQFAEDWSLLKQMVYHVCGNNNLLVDILKNIGSIIFLGLWLIKFDILCSASEPICNKITHWA